jgi:hypothetical protein
MSKIHFSILFLFLVISSCIGLKSIDSKDIEGVFSFKSMESIELLKLKEDQTFTYYTFYSKNNSSSQDSCKGSFSIYNKSILLSPVESESSSCTNIISPSVLGPDAINLELRIVNKNHIRIGYKNGYQRPFKRVK